MNEIVRKLILLTILLSGTQVISLPFSNLTIFQISLIVSILCAVVGLIYNKIIRNGEYLVFSIIFALSSVLARIISTNPEWANSYLLLGLMTAALVFIMPNYFDIRDTNLLEKTLIRSQYLVIPFSFYSFYMFYYKNGLPMKVELVGGLFIELDQETILRGQASSQLRLMLPYATPPVLSVVMGMCIIMLLTNAELFTLKKRLFLLVLFAGVLLLTGSRTGMIGLFLALFFVALHYLGKRKSLNKKTMFCILFCVIGGLLVVIYGLNLEYGKKLLKRFALSNILEDRHLLVPLDGILIWLGSLKNFFLGIGFGSSVNMDGIHTYLPPYFLNSFVTLVAERGMAGLVIVIELFYLNWKILIKRQKGAVSLGNALLVGMLCCVFYEALNCYFLIFTIAVGYCVLNGHNSTIKNFEG